jgi:hypothetical protein
VDLGMGVGKFGGAFCGNVDLIAVQPAPIKF